MKGTAKKIIMAIIAGMVLMASSCNKKCTCKIWYDGYVPRYYEGVPLDKGQYKSCSEMDSMISLDPKEGKECIDE